MAEKPKTDEELAAEGIERGPNADDPKPDKPRTTARPPPIPPDVPGSPGGGGGNNQGTG